MGQKVHPIGIRLGVVRDWSSKWYARPEEYAAILEKDFQARDYLYKKLSQAGVGEILIERPANNVRITIKSARPGVIFGKSGKDVEDLRNELTSMMNAPVHIKVEEIRKPDLDARLVAEGIAQQIEKRVMYRRAMKRAIKSVMAAGAKGVKIKVSGRLAGAEIARSEWYKEGRVPLHTLRADIDYALAEAKTTYGIIGVKVWIFRGEILGIKENETTAE